MKRRKRQRRSLVQPYKLSNEVGFLVEMNAGSLKINRAVLSESINEELPMLLAEGIRAEMRR